MNSSPFPVIFALDALTGACFLLTAIGVVATRQVLASLQLFIAQSLLLTLSALLLGIATGSPHLFAVAAITIATKTLLIPWVLRHTVSAAVYRTREIERVLNIPSSLLIAAVLVSTRLCDRESSPHCGGIAVCSYQSAARPCGDVPRRLYSRRSARGGAAASRPSGARERRVLRGHRDRSGLARNRRARCGRGRSGRRLGGWFAHTSNTQADQNYGRR